MAQPQPISYQHLIFMDEVQRQTNVLLSESVRNPLGVDLRELEKLRFKIRKWRNLTRIYSSIVISNINNFQRYRNNTVSERPVLETIHVPTGDLYETKEVWGDRFFFIHGINQKVALYNSVLLEQMRTVVMDWSQQTNSVSNSLMLNISTINTRVYNAQRNRRVPQNQNLSFEETVNSMFEMELEEDVFAMNDADLDALLETEENEYQQYLKDLSELNEPHGRLDDLEWWEKFNKMKGVLQYLDPERR